MANGQVTIDPGQTNATILIQVIGDNDIEPDEVFSVSLDSISGDAQFANTEATGTILSDDVQIPTVTVSDTEIGEGNAPEIRAMEFTVSLDGVSDQPVIIGYSTSSLAGAGQASAGVDYHDVFDKEAEFLTTQAGIVLRF